MKTKAQAAKEYADSLDWITDTMHLTGDRRQCFLAGVKFANKWEDGNTPPTQEDYPKLNELQCLIVRKDRSSIEMAYYDFHYKSWNDADNDDHFCDVEQVEKWKPIDNE